MPWHEGQCFVPSHRTCRLADMVRTTWFVAAFSALLVLFGSPAAPADVNKIVARLEARYRSATTLQATFLERYSEGGRATRVESGTVSFRRPAKMRWEYESPEPKLFVSDGRTIWFYVPGDKTVMRSPVKKSADWRTPFALLTHDAKVSELCSRVEMETEGRGSVAGHAVLRCTPKGQEEEIKEILIGVDSATGDIERVTIHGAAGVEIDFRFANWVRDLPLIDSKFRFIAPAGVAIVQGQASQGGADH